MGVVPSQDQVMGQLRVIIPAVGTIVTAIGIYSPDKVGPVVAQLLTATGPIAYVVCAVWSLIANSRASIMASAAKPAAPGVAPPEILLPVQERALAAKLPDNVTAK